VGGRQLKLTAGLIVTLCLALLGVTVISFAGLYRSVAVAADAESKEPLTSDFIVVLGAGVQPGGQPSPALRARAELGVKLYQQGYAKYLVVTGGVGPNPPAEAEVMRQIALADGVPAEAIVVENKARNTQESASLVKAIAIPRGWTRALIVSDPYHLPRASWMFSDAGFVVSTAGTNDYYYSPRTRAYQTGRECLGLFAYALQRPFLALAGN
jgi:uncharacterized SAM-binding protein YcdF (DUF218 family)